MIYRDEIDTGNLSGICCVVMLAFFRATTTATVAVSVTTEPETENGEDSEGYDNCYYSREVRYGGLGRRVLCWGV